ncbi:MAG: hypothetical protein KDE56_28110, partial [Anaerolineales bacterium]|nr:hypothetical protein [Anaerolineales bacterium]
LLAVFDYYLRQRMPGLNWLSFLARPLAATAVMFLTMWATSQLHVLLAALLGPLAYLLALWMLRVVGDEERAILRSILPTRLAARLKLA